MDDINHSTIYNWFDKCGVISSIRTQLRQSLVLALKFKDINLSQAHLKSAKQYVYDLLIAEYLLKTNFAYTLSVFTSEAPVPSYFDQLLISKDSKSHGKLQKDYLLHVLETLGINVEGSKAQFILSEYAKNDESLLICILQCLKYYSSEKRVNAKIYTNKERFICKDEFTQTDGTVDCDKCKNLSQMEKKLVKQKEEFDLVLLEKSEELRIQALGVEQQMILLQEKMEQAQSIMRSLNEQKKQFAEEKRQEEEMIHQKKLELLHKEEHLTREMNRLDIERNSSKQFEENLQRLQSELIKIKRGLSADEKKQLDSDLRDTQVQTDFQSFTMDWSERELLQREKHDLNSLVREQQERIKYLTHRAVQLSRQLEEFQLTRINNVQIPLRIPHTSTFISEGSSTEDILQDAKSRLKRLEEESMQAEKRYQDYILKNNT